MTVAVGRSPGIPGNFVRFAGIVGRCARFVAAASVVGVLAYPGESSSKAQMSTWEYRGLSAELQEQYLLGLTHSFDYLATRDERLEIFFLLLECTDRMEDSEMRRELNDWLAAHPERGKYAAASNFIAAMEEVCNL